MLNFQLLSEDTFRGSLNDLNKYYILFENRLQKSKCNIRQI